ncbi:TetR/AcrR family transcriptional regulator [Mycetocola sp. 2940]|uniref:TetR/AcrR family transcriptional regulator n=1 Tax=Mycetocola sp. 2940 TaxID=3156452 RepID=UPI00339A7AEC
MPRVSTEYRQARRDEIADAALRCFSERGFQATSMADIIDASGLSAGAIYGHYAGKQAIVVAVAERILGQRSLELERFASAGVVPSPAEVIRLMVTRVADEFAGTRALLQVWAEAVVTPEISTLVDRVFARVRGALALYLGAWAAQNPHPSRPHPAEWAESVTPVLLGIGQGYIVQSTLVASFDAEKYFAGVDALFTT